MGRRGPQPQPTALRIERGNPGHRPLNDAEPELPAPSPKMPAGLKGKAKAEWLRLIDVLIGKGTLTVGDLNAFEQYCRLAGHVDECEKLIQKVGFESAHDLGYYKTLAQLSGHLRQWSGHLGLTSTSRSGVKAAKVQTPADTQRARFFGAKPA